MTPVNQTIFGYPHGNCFAASVASLIDTPIEEVPNFCDEANDNWYTDAQKWCDERGFVMVSFEWNEDLRQFLTGVDEYYELAGQSPRGDWLHSVIGYKGQMVHDPHPDNTFIVGDPVYAILIVKKERAIFLEDGRFELLQEAA